MTDHLDHNYAETTGKRMIITMLLNFVITVVRLSVSLRIRNRVEE